MSDGWLLVGDEPTETDHKAFARRLSNALGLIQLVGSAEAFLAAHALFKEALQDYTEWHAGLRAEKGAQPKLAVFVFAARKDLGETRERSIQREIDRALPLDEDN